MHNLQLLPFNKPAYIITFFSPTSTKSTHSQYFFSLIISLINSCFIYFICFEEGIYFILFNYIFYSFFFLLFMNPFFFIMMGDDTLTLRIIRNTC